MSKEVFGESDNNRSIRDIHIERSSKDSNTLHLDRESFKKGGSGIKRKNKRSVLKWVVSAAVLLLLIIISSSLFHRAEVVVEPRKENVPLETIFSASNEDETLAGFEVVTLEASGVSKVDATGEEEVSEVATGKITISNTGAATTWVKTTRFEANDGKLYRASNSVSIPAGTASNPSETEVSVYADQPGQEYNVESGLTFTVAGLKGTASYDNFAGIQKTPFTGGFSGVKKIASDEDFEAAKEDLNERLKNQLMSKLMEDYSETKIILTENVVFSSTLSQDTSDDGNVDVKSDASIKAIVFPKTKLTDIIAQKVLPESVSSEDLIVIDNVSALDFEIVEEDYDIDSGDDFRFFAKGDAEFVWQVDENTLTTQILGKRLSEIQEQVLSARKDITKVDIDISPFWRQVVPDNKNKVYIEVLYTN